MTLTLRWGPTVAALVCGPVYDEWMALALTGATVLAFGQMDASAVVVRWDGGEL